MRAPLARLLGLIGMQCHRKQLGLEEETLNDYLYKAGRDLDNVVCDIIKKTEGLDAPAINHKPPTDDETTTDYPY